MSALTNIEGLDLINQIDVLFNRLREAEFPRLKIVNVKDDGEKYKTLRCSACGSLVDADDLYAVDFAERWTSADDVDSDETLGARMVDFHFDESGEFGGTLYYRHDDHPVRLPKGWKENAL